MLGGWQSTQSSVKHAPGPGHLALLGQELAVVNPDPGHLVHPDQAPLKAAVDRVIARVSHTPTLHLLPAHLEVIVPELVAAGKLLQRSLEHKVQHILRSISFVL